MPRRELRPDQVWLIGVPLNLLLAVPCVYPVALGMFGLQILAGELGLAEVEVAGEADVKIFFGLVAFLLAGLVVFGRDGTMTTYAALVAVCGTVQWLAMRGWRR